MVITVAIGSLGDVFKAMIVEHAKKGRITIVPKVSLKRLALFETLGDGNFERSSVRKPMDPIGKRIIAKHVQHFL